MRQQVIDAQIEAALKQGTVERWWQARDQPLDARGLAAMNHTRARVTDVTQT